MCDGLTAQGLLGRREYECARAPEHTDTVSLQHTCCTTHTCPQTRRLTESRPTNFLSVWGWPWRPSSDQRYSIPTGSPVHQSNPKLANLVRRCHKAWYFCVLFGSAGYLQSSQDALVRHIHTHHACLHTNHLDGHRSSSDPALLSLSHVLYSAVHEQSLLLTILMMLKVPDVF
jgi:hypothetical protein